MKKYILTILSATVAVSTIAAAPSAAHAASPADAPQIDTTGLYSDQADTLAAATVRTGFGNYLSKGRELRTEVISAAGLCKMACCNLAESFENSASVTVGYSDAVTGARQIRLLGLSGVYTQMLDENRPIMRGVAAPFGLNYVPGQWLSSIQIAKGAPSVINGVESITGQINLEHRKPTDEIPFFLNAAVMSDTKMDLNLASSLQIGTDGKWSTVLLGHVSGNFMGHDINMKANDGAGTGFLAEPNQLLVNVGNRWLYYGEDGTQVRFGVRFLRDTRAGGQYDHNGGWRHQAAYNYEAYKAGQSNFWGSSILNQGVNAYLKVGVPLNPDNTRNFAVVGDFNDYSMNSTFGRTLFNTNQISGFVNLLYQDQVLDDHHFTVGLSSTYDRFNEQFDRPGIYSLSSNKITHIGNVAAFGEYTYRFEEKLSLIAGLRADWYNIDKKPLRVSPRITARITPVDQLVIRLNGGRGVRYANPLADNLGVLSTNKYYFSEHNPTTSPASALFLDHPIEDAWVFGGNLTWYMPWEVVEGAYLSFDYFRTQFVDQLIVDYNGLNANSIDFYMTDGRKSFTDTYQVDFSIEPVERFTINATFRYTNAKVTMLDANRAMVLQERPMTSRYKGVLNLQYATHLNKWIFDVTASVNGPCKVYDYMKGMSQINEKGYSQVYPLLYAQITHRMKGWDLYIGGENLTNFKQKDVIIGDPNRDIAFDASNVWGPLMGIKGYIGVRVTLWK